MIKRVMTPRVSNGRPYHDLRPRYPSPFLPDPLSSTTRDPAEPNEFELNFVWNEPRKLETIRLRLRNYSSVP